MLEYYFTGTGRELRRNINMILKKKMANNIKIINYAKEYSLGEDNKITKNEIKKVYIETDNKEKLEAFLSNFSTFKTW